MKVHVYRMSGVIGLSIGYCGILLSIILSPWFSLRENALSDLGHATSSNVAALFNITLVLTGFILYNYSVRYLVNRYRFSGYLLAITSFFLILVGVFDEVYGGIHWFVSLCFFMLLGATSIVYSVEAHNFLGITAFIIGLSSWAILWSKVFKIGAAVPELVSIIAVSIWIIYECIK